MKGRIGLLLGFGAGYVLGTRDGRQRYDKLKAQAVGLWQRPEVQDKVEAVSGLVSQALGRTPSRTAGAHRDDAGSASSAAGAAGAASGAVGGGTDRHG